MTDTPEQRVAAGYDAVYAALPNSASFARLWREHACGADFPAGFDHISFLTLEAMRTMAHELQLQRGATLVDLACGMGSPGLWIARETGATLTGIDVSLVAVQRAQARAEALGLSDIARFATGTFADTGIESGAADGVMSVDALQYAPDKQAAMHEAARILRPGGRFVSACFELDPQRLAGVPILGDDPTDDYGPLLERAGFDVVRYEETPGWHERLTAAYQAVIDQRAALTAELGEPAYAALFGEMSLTLQLQPYRRRVMVVAATRRT